MSFSSRKMVGCKYSGRHQPKHPWQLCPASRCTAKRSHAQHPHGCESPGKQGRFPRRLLAQGWCFPALSKYQSEFRRAVPTTVRLEWKQSCRQLRKRRPIPGAHHSGCDHPAVPGVLTSLSARSRGDAQGPPSRSTPAAPRAAPQGRGSPHPTHMRIHPSRGVRMTLKLPRHSHS